MFQTEPPVRVVQPAFMRRKSTPQAIPPPFILFASHCEVKTVSFHGAMPADDPPIQVMVCLLIVRFVLWKEIICWLIETGRFFVPATIISFHV